MMRSLLTLYEASAILCLHPNTLRNKIKSKQIGHIKQGGQYFLSENQIQNYLDALTIPPNPISNFSLLPNINNDCRMVAKEVSGMGRKPKTKFRENLNVTGSVRLRRFKHCNRWVIDYRNRDGKRVQQVVKHAQTEEEAYIALQDAVRKEFDDTYRAQEEIGKMTFREFGNLFLEKLF